MNALASWAQRLARTLLREPRPRRWSHVQGVAAWARSLAPVLGADADLLEAAAWLHDIGYAPGLAATGLHALEAPATCATPSTPKPCCAGWSPITPTPSSKP
jgi:HD domain